LRNWSKIGNVKRAHTKTSEPKWTNPRLVRQQVTNRIIIYPVNAPPFSLHRFLKPKLCIANLSITYIVFPVQFVLYKFAIGWSRFNVARHMQLDRIWNSLFRNQAAADLIAAASQVIWLRYLISSLNFLTVHLSCLHYPAVIWSIQKKEKKEKERERERERELL